MKPAPEYKTISNPIEYKVNKDTREVESYASIFGNRDLGGDVVHPGAFKRSLAIRGLDVPLLWQHDSYVPLARPRVLREDSKGLFGVDRFAKTRAADETLELLDEQVIKGMSFGWLPFEGGMEKSAEGRELRDIDVFERSVATFPMNEAASVTAVRKSFLGQIGIDPETFRKEFKALHELNESLRKARQIDVNALFAKGARLRSLLRDLIDAAAWNSDERSYSDVTRDMAAAAGLTEAQTSDLIWGSSDSPSDAVLTAFAGALGVDAGRLIGARMADTVVPLSSDAEEAAADIMIEAKSFSSRIRKLTESLRQGAA